MKLLLILFSISVLSCNQSNEKNNSPDASIIKNFKIKNEQIVYQYYEKFGFTDLCYHTRSYFFIKNFQLTDDWKILPISGDDLGKINSMPNKTDKMNFKFIHVIYEKKSEYEDISLDRREFIRDTTFKIDMPLINGFYRFKEDTFEIYFKDFKILYSETHKCDD